jgi:hypothetical protein
MGFPYSSLKVEGYKDNIFDHSWRWNKHLYCMGFTYSSLKVEGYKDNLFEYIHYVKTS